MGKQAQSSQGSLTWMQLGVATKLLAVAELSMQRMAAYTSLPRSKVSSCFPHVVPCALLMCPHWISPSYDMLLRFSPHCTVELPRLDLTVL